MNGLILYLVQRVVVVVDGNAGKGSRYRPVNMKKYAENWKAAFSKNKETKENKKGLNKPKLVKGKNNE